MTDVEARFNPPPGWPKPPPGWKPPKGWAPDPNWPEPPEGWQLWVTEGPRVEAPEVAASEGSASPLDAATNARPVDGIAFSKLKAENQRLRRQLASRSGVDDLVVLDDERVLQAVGVYRYHHPLESADAYKARLKELSAAIATMIREKAAIEMSNSFTLDNSLAKGRRMSSDLGKLMLRAYNAEVDNAIRTLRVGNVVTAKRRIEASRTAILKLGKLMEMHISDRFHALRLQELELTADFLMKKQEEREEAREERARIREEKRVQAELAAEREKLDKERSHIMNALESLRIAGETNPDLEDRLHQLDEAIVQNDTRAANIRAGYVYVISNRGTFGEGVVKIGLTRRLEPLERISELSGASVPFRFDVHAIYFSEDAVSLENELHQHFADCRVNQANNRKEFFFASPIDVRDVLAEKVGSLLEFVEHAEATEFWQSLPSWPDRRQGAESVGGGIEDD